MKIRKEELSDLLFWKYGVLEGERERSEKYIKKIKESELEISTKELFDILEDMLNYVWKENTQDTEEDTEEDVEEDTEETRKFVYDFFFNW